MTQLNLTDAQIIEETFREAFMAVMAATDPCPDCDGEVGSECETCDGLGMAIPRSGVPTETRDALARAWEAASGKDQVVS